MARRPVVRDPIADTLEEIMETHEYRTLDDAMEHALREAGYDV